MATLPDNRIRFPSPKIDFEVDVGITGGDHDNYPASGDQARFDHQRLYLIGLLSQQSSYSEPSEKREGTPWFDLNTLALKVWHNSAWHLYSEIIPLEIDSENNVTSLKNWYDSVADALNTLSSKIVFNGSANATVDVITIPESLRSALTSESRCFVYVNGLLLDPRTCTLVGSPIPTSISLVTVNLDDGDNFTVIIERIASATYHTPTVLLP